MRVSGDASASDYADLKLFHVSDPFRITGRCPDLPSLYSPERGKSSLYRKFHAEIPETTGNGKRHDRKPVMSFSVFCQIALRKHNSITWQSRPPGP
jgi:hypothetical protein